MATETANKTSPKDLPDHLKIEVTTDKVRTRGWVKFDKWVHWGIGLGLNIAMALTMSIFQINRGLNYKIDKAKEIANLDANNSKRAEMMTAYGFTEDSLRNFASANQNGKRRAEGGFILGKIFDFSEWVHKGTDFVFGVGRNEYEQAVYKKGDKKGQLMEGSDLPLFSGIASDVLALSIPGHVATAMIQFFEQPWLKPKLVRWFDKREDAKRIAKGETITEEELAERAAIYKKLDNELAGKSFAQMWGARFMGIGMVVASLIGLGMADRAITKQPMNKTGLNRVGQGVRWPFAKLSNALGEESPQWLQDATTSTPDNPNSVFSSRMLELVGTEVAGSTITAATQYVTVMWKELFTNEYKDKKKEAKHAPVQAQKDAAVKPHAVSDTHPEHHAPQAAQPATHAPEKSADKKVAATIQPRQPVTEKAADHKEAVERSRTETQHALVGA